MATDVIMPKMGFDMTEGTLRRWLKAEGDAVEPGEALGEVETGKVDIEIEAFDGGVLACILVAEGETVPVGAAIAVIAAPGEEVPERPRAVPPSPVTSDGVDADGSGAEGGVASSTSAGAEGGVASNTSSGSGSVADDGAVASNTSAGAEGDVHAAAGVRADAAADAGADAMRRRASPLARRLAAEHDISLAKVRGTGPGGRIVRDDVKVALDRRTVPAAIAPVPDGSDDPTSRREELSQMRRTIARRLTGSWTSAPHIFVTMSIDMTDALALRRDVNEALADDGIKVSVNDMVIKAVADALRHDPRLNVSWSDGQVMVHDRISVGSAVALDDGLFTVVVPDADRTSIGDLSRLLTEKTARARSGKLLAEDVATPGTFSVTNLGMYGVDEFTAIINPPEAAILAVGAAEPRAVVRDGAVAVRNVMKATLSADHRVVDGSTAAEFLARLKSTMEQPVRLLV